MLNEQDNLEYEYFVRMIPGPKNTVYPIGKYFYIGAQKPNSGSYFNGYPGAKDFPTQDGEPHPEHRGMRTLREAQNMAEINGGDGHYWLQEAVVVKRAKILIVSQTEVC